MICPFFITASGTGIGKTFLTSLFVRSLKRRGRHVSAIKPVISGWDPEDLTCDTLQIASALGVEANQASIDNISPWRFKEPLSPHLAAAAEQQTISLDALVRHCRDSAHAASDILLIEGVGGVMVPLNEEHMVLDWMKALHYPAIIVVGSYLGSLNHSLTTFAAVAAQGIPIHAVVVSESEDSNVRLQDTVDTLAHFSPYPIHALERNPSDASQDAITEAIFFER